MGGGSPLRLSFSVTVLTAFPDAPLSGRNTEWGFLQEPENLKFSDRSPQLWGRVRKVGPKGAGGCGLIAGWVAPFVFSICAALEKEKNLHYGWNLFILRPG